MKSLIIGLDLSFNSTGICFSHLENHQGQRIKFFNLLYDDGSRKRRFEPKYIKNVNHIIYRMPTDVLLDDIILDKNDVNNFEQLHATLRGMISVKKIFTLISEEISRDQYDEIIICIENFIMPAFAGKNQLKTVAGLIMMQGFLRAEIIKYCAGKKLNFKLLTPSPTTNKYNFTKNGKADKSKMIESFINIYEGKQLIPTIEEDKNKLEDVVDAFSLMMYGYSKIIKNI